MANPTIQSIASENVDKSSYGGSLGFLQSAASLGRILGPAIGGGLFSLLSKNAPYYSSGLVILATYLVVRKYLPSASIWQQLKSNKPISS